MPFDYAAPENNIIRRGALSPRMRRTLLESTREDWPEHPRFGGKASFFLNIHGNLLNGAGHLAGGLEALLDAPASEVQDALEASRLKRLGSDLIAFAHHHHEIEDRYYFPQFTRVFPAMEHAIALLDGDHRVLEEALNDTEKGLDALRTRPVDRDAIARVYKGSRALEKIISRHLWDEEEIIVPIFLLTA
jgi:hypothetical protein